MNPLAALLASAALGWFLRVGLPAVPKEKRWDPFIVAAAGSQGIHPALLKAIVEVESNYDLNATRNEGGGRVSVGLAQILWPDTAVGLGFNGTADQLKGPHVNLGLAAKLLRELLDRFGTVPSAVSHYNCGRCPADRAYTRRVLALYEKFWEEF